MQEVENQLQQEYESSRDQISSLEDQMLTEKRRRDDAEIEVSKQKQVTCHLTVKHYRHQIKPIEFFIMYAGRKSVKASFYNAAEKSVILNKFKLSIKHKNCETN